MPAAIRTETSVMISGVGFFGTYLYDGARWHTGDLASVDDLDDADVFVEVKTARFVAALGLPPIAELPG